MHIEVESYVNVRMYYIHTSQVTQRSAHYQSLSMGAVKSKVGVSAFMTLYSR